MRLPARPTIYEINTAVWLGDLSRRLGPKMSLANVPAAEWDRLAALRIDAVWLMGVWQRSPAGLGIAQRNPELQSSFHVTLPDLNPDDVIGSPYCVRGYVLEPRFGGPKALASARAALARRGVGLILDYVPNHVAPDHPWTIDHGDYFIRGTAAELEAGPAAFLQTAAGVLANGKDPYFAPWPDVVQLNAFSPGLRGAVIDTLVSIGEQCDGVRCDMAMLMTNEVFARTWGSVPVHRRARTTGRRSSRRSVRDIPTSCSSPRPTGTWSGRFSSRGLTTATTSACMTALSASRRSRCAPTCRPRTTTRSGWCASSRTTTSPARLTRSRRRRHVRRPS